MLKASEPLRLAFKDRNREYHQSITFTSNGDAQVECAACSKLISYSLSPKTKLIIGYFLKEWIESTWWDSGADKLIDQPKSEWKPITKTGIVCRQCLDSSGQAELVEYIKKPVERLYSGSTLQTRLLDGQPKASLKPGIQRINGKWTVITAESLNDYSDRTNVVSNHARFRADRFVKTDREHRDETHGESLTLGELNALKRG